MGVPATILFDGVCNLCDASVRFIIANDPEAHFRFAALQSDAGRALLRVAGRDPASIDSVVLIDAQGGVHERSDAALRIVGKLRPPWRALAVLRVIPADLRDLIYTTIARNRYRWFGTRSSCVVPTAAQRARFL